MLRLRGYFHSLTFKYANQIYQKLRFLYQHMPALRTFPFRFSSFKSTHPSPIANYGSFFSFHYPACTISRAAVGKVPVLLFGYFADDIIRRVFGKPVNPFLNNKRFARLQLQQV